MPRPSRRQAISGLTTAPFVAWALVRVSGVAVGYPLVDAIAFTPQAAALSPLAVVVALVLRTRAIAAVAGAAVVVLAGVVLPRGVDGPQPASARTRGTPLVVMTANLYLGRADARALLRLAREHHVDVLSLQELTPEAVRHLDAAGARALLPGRVLEPRTGAAGSGLLARHALQPVRTDANGGHEQPEARLVLPGGQELRVRAVHPVPPTSPKRVKTWRRQLDSLGGAAAAGGARRLLAGDFNATLDHRELRDVLGRGFHDAADATGDGLRATWPVGRVASILTLDHVLIPEAIAVSRVTVHDVPGTDHRALIAELVVPER
jgi:endonuclease/exonuclease/phosphatase (EEP) superfamily protein YafD